MLTDSELKNLQTIFVYANTYGYDTASSYWTNRRYRSDIEVRKYNLQKTKVLRAISDITNIHLISLILEYHRDFNTHTLLGLDSDKFNNYRRKFYDNRDDRYNWIIKMNKQKFKDLLLDTSVAVEDSYTIWLLSQE